MIATIADHPIRNPFHSLGSVRAAEAAGLTPSERVYRALVAVGQPVSMSWIGRAAGTTPSEIKVALNILSRAGKARSFKRTGERAHWWCAVSQACAVRRW